MLLRAEDTFLSRSHIAVLYSIPNFLFWRHPAQEIQHAKYDADNAILETFSSSLKGQKKIKR